MKTTKYQLLLILAGFLHAGRAFATPISVAGDTFILVATDSGSTPVQMFGLAADAEGNVYAGNNSNNQAGVPLRRFRPSTFVGSPVSFDNFGPACQDADGLTFGAGFLYVADLTAGVRKISAADGTGSILLPNSGRNDTGSPLAYRASDGHIFVGYGTGARRLDEFDAAGSLVTNVTTSALVETMTLDPASGIIYYAPWPDGQIWAYNPTSRTDTLVAAIGGTIDGGLAFDARSGRLFVGTANGANQGRVYTVDLATGTVALFAFGFDGCLGILRDQTTGDLYFLEAHNLYRLQKVEAAFRPKLFIWPGVELGWLSDTNQTYQVQWCSALHPNTNTWFDFGLPVRGNGTTNFLSDTTLTSTNRFYRLVVLPH
jgi:hypothetical protein